MTEIPANKIFKAADDLIALNDAYNSIDENSRVHLTQPKMKEWFKQADEWFGLLLDESPECGIALMRIAVTHYKLPFNNSTVPNHKQFLTNNHKFFITEDELNHL